MRVPAGHGHTAWQGKLSVGSYYTAGLAGQVFLAALKERGEILGTRCGRCDHVYVPAALFCERCFAELSVHVPVGPGGEVVSFTACRVDLDGAPLDPPQVVVAVRLDGATSVLVHRGLGSPDAWRIGGRAKAKLAATRTGSINDIAGFEPA